jgi:hypothetical protein
MKKTTLYLTLLVAFVVSFAGYNFIRAYDESVWFPPAGSPPTRNVAVPLNHGSTTSFQLGFGNLAFDQFTAFSRVNASQYCDVSGGNCFTAASVGTGGSGGGASCRIDVQNSVGCGNPAPCPTGYVAVGPTWGGQTCSGSGNNTVTQSCVATICTNPPAGATYHQNVLGASQTGYNSYWSWGYPVDAYVSVSQYPVCFLTTTYIPSRDDDGSQYAGAGGCQLNNDGTNWRLTATAQKRSSALCMASCITW